MDVDRARASTHIPAPPRRSHRRDWGQLLARIVCVLFATVGVLPFGLVMIVHSAWARTWATRETTRLAASFGVVASYDVSLTFWPFAVVIDHVRVESSDGGGPVLVTPRVTVRPKFFALLSGKLAIDQVEVDSPRARAVVKDGNILNLALKLPAIAKKTGPFHAPFSVIAVTDGFVDVQLDEAHLVVTNFDLDVTNEDDRDDGSSFEVALRVGESRLHMSRLTYPNGDDKPPQLFVDDDALCMVDARLRIDPDAITVHRLRAEGSADLDPQPATTPRCGLPETDKRKVTLSLSHLHVHLPKTPGGLPRVDGHITARAPLGLVERAADLPRTDGWVGVDLEARFTEGMSIPDVNGHIEAHDIQIDHFNFAQEIQADLVTKQNVVTSPRITVRIADGQVILSDVSVQPLVKGIPIKAKFDAKDINFTTLMRNLGVHPHAHVAWDIREIHVPMLAGTIVPLKIDGELTGHTQNFTVYDIPAESPARVRIFGIKEALIVSHVGVRPEAVQFSRARVTLNKSVAEGGFVSLGYNNDLKVDVPSAKIDLTDLSPIGQMPLAGQAEAHAQLTGVFGDPHLEADATIQNFVFSGIPFGNVTAGHASLNQLTVDLKNVKATKNKSTYEMPVARLEFGGAANMTMDAVATSSGFNLRDFFNLWQLDEDPRFLEIDGTFSTKSNLHIALGGPEDHCGGGFINVDAHAHLRDAKLFGEVFDDGDLDVDYEWVDRLGGIEGANIQVHSATLRKLRPNAAGIAVGTMLASAAIKRGELNGNVVLQGIPLSRIQSLGAVAPEIDGAVSGLLQVSGKIDQYKLDGDVDITPTLVRGTRVGGSHLHLGMTQVASSAKPLGKTQCGSPLVAAFDKEAYFRDTSSQGDFTLDGDLFGGQVHLDHVDITRQADAQVTGKVGLRKFDVGAVTRIITPPVVEDDQPPPTATEGEISGDLTIERLKRSDLAHASLRFAPTSFSLARAGQTVALRTKSSVVVLSDDKVSVPSLIFDLNAQNGFKGAVTVKGDITKVTSAPVLAIDAELAPIDLGVLVGLVPRLDRAQGTLSGALRLSGKATSPEVDGAMHVRGGDFSVHGLPSAISNVEVDVQADASEVRITRGSARFAGGTVAIGGRVPMHGLSLGAGEITARGRGVRLTPVDGVAATVDTDLTLVLSSPTSEGRAPLPHLTGEVTLTSFEYTRPISLTTDLNSLGRGAKRTVVESYDPSFDLIAIDLSVKARSPLRIRNNLVEVQLGIASGSLTVSGTNQRQGLRGELRALPGGRFHLRASEFDIRQAIIRFDDPTRIAPNVDVLAVTEYRRYGDSAASGAGGTGQSAGLWRISVHAYGDTENLRLDMTSDPPLSQEDVVLLLTIGMTRAEVDQLQAGALGAGAALEAIATVSGADRAVKNAIPVIDDFRFGSGYSMRTGRTEPQVTVGKRITEDVRANVTTGLAENRELRSNIEWRLGQRIGVQASYDNINDVSSSALGNVGLDFRWRLEFE